MRFFTAVLPVALVGSAVSAASPTSTKTWTVNPSTPTPLPAPGLGWDQQTATINCSPSADGSIWQCMPVPASMDLNIYIIKATDPNLRNGEQFKALCRHVDGKDDQCDITRQPEQPQEKGADWALVTRPEPGTKKPGSAPLKGQRVKGAGSRRIQIPSVFLIPRHMSQMVARLYMTTSALLHGASVNAQSTSTVTEVLTNVRITTLPEPTVTTTVLPTTNLTVTLSTATANPSLSTVTAIPFEYLLNWTSKLEELEQYLATHTPVVPATVAQPKVYTVKSTPAVITSIFTAPAPSTGGTTTTGASSNPQAVTLIYGPVKARGARSSQAPLVFRLLGSVLGRAEQGLKRLEEGLRWD